MSKVRVAGGDRNPQAEMMADESMVRNLAMQASAIWPQEEEFYSRYRLPIAARVIDVGCGTGEISARIARRFADAHVTGIDVLEGPLAVARTRYGDVAGRLDFQVGDAFHLDFADATFDLAVCRHMLQAVPDADRVLAELGRVTRPGGWIHTVSEDYGMLHMMSGPRDPDRFWQAGPVQFAEKTGTDARFGRRTWSAMRALGLQDLRVDYVIVDTLRVDRGIFAGIMIAWRDGYSEALASHAGMSTGEIRQHFDEIIASIQNPDHYAVWFVPVISGRKPGS
ncbi:MAG TPA: methyltransferase domain-containing protein [Steroidobacteraceae bacterium]|nr:methyltransferase domain-containing protein [Steroidobacteraceae bacterium]